MLQSRQDSTGGTGSHSTDQLLKLVANPFQGSIQINAFWASLATSLGVTAGLALVFSLLRPRHTLVYAPKIKHADSQHAPPPMGKGPLSWIGPVRTAKETVLVDKIGMDAVVFLRFTRMLRNIFLVLAVLGVAIMIPVNISLSVKEIVDRSNSFAIMTPLYIFGSGLWAQVIMAYIIDLVVAYFLWLNYRRIFALRRTYFASREYQQSLHARSVLIRHLPASFRTDEGILRIVDAVNPSGSMPKPTLGRNVKLLPDLIEEHEETVRQLESALATYLKNPDRLPATRPTMKPPRKYKGQSVNGRVDSIQYLTDRIRELEAQIADMRERIDKRDAMPYGFASWDQVSEAHTVAYAAKKKSPHGTKIQLAPRPNDLIWKNLSLSKAALKRKSMMNFVWVTVLTIIWTPINAGIAIFLSNLANLGSVWPAFQRQLEAHKTGWSIVQGIASPAITSLVYLCLPIIFRRLQIRAGDVTKTARERHVLRNLYLFFTLNNLIVFSIFSAVWQYITSVINNSQNDANVWDALKEGDFFLTVTTSLCQISPFWVTWILQRNLGAAIDLAQLWTLFYIWFAKTFLAPTPRQNIEWTAPPAFAYSSYYNYFLFYSTIALTFATLQPIVLVVTALYFTVDAVLKKYLLMYVFITKTESGGEFWRTLFNRLVFAVILSNVIIGVVVKARGTWSMVIALVPLLFLMLGFKLYCRHKFDADMHFYHRAGMQDTERSDPEMNPKVISKATSRFRHPALDQPLMTPMVHAKARHVLNQIYRGRLASEAGGPPDVHAAIPMQPMNQTGPPQQNAPFEIVPEAQQDFAYYKNRADFKGEGGDIYGKSDDIISRSGTPASFMTGPPRVGSPASEAGSRTPFSGSQDIPRKAYNQSNLHPALRRGVGVYDKLAQGEPDVDAGDIGVEPRHGAYTDPNDDRTNLLRDIGDIRTPNGDFISLDQWRTDGSTPQGKEDAGSYDYFRGGHR